MCVFIIQTLNEYNVKKITILIIYYINVYNKFIRVVFVIFAPNFLIYNNNNIMIILTGNEIKFDFTLVYSYNIIHVRQQSG